MNYPRLLARTITAAFVAAFALTADASTTGSSLSVNFGSNQPSEAGGMLPADVAGVIPTANWNNAPGATGNLSNLTADVNGAPIVLSGTTVTWSATGTWDTDQEDNTNNFPLPGDAKMMSGYLDLNVNTAGSIIFNGLPNGLYNVYVYTLTAVNNRDSGNIVVNGVTEKSLSIQSTSYQEGGGPGGVDNVGGVPGNFNFYPGVNVTNGNITIGLPGTTFRTAVNGIELVSSAIPEPSSVGLAILGAIAVGARRRRR